jgi:protein-tyrosine-phosphatase
MAAGFAQHLGADHINAHSAGSKPSGKVNETAILVMKEKGIDLSTSQSKGFSDLPNVSWDYVITMGCGDVCPFVPSKATINWDLPDPKKLPLPEFRAVRDEIEKRVIDLIKKVTTA